MKNEFGLLEREIQISLHSRDLHRKASVIYNHPDMFTTVQRAWALWVLSSQGFSGQLDSSYGYDVAKNSSPKKLNNKKEAFSLDLAIRLQDVQLECADALYIIRSRDRAESFFYCDPPYYNSDMVHYDGYSLADYTELLEALSNIKGKFMLSSYPSAVLAEYTARHGWHTRSFDSKVSVAAKAGNQKTKTEVITANYPI